MSNWTDEVENARVLLRATGAQTDSEAELTALAEWVAGDEAAFTALAERFLGAAGWDPDDGDPAPIPEPRGGDLPIAA